MERGSRNSSGRNGNGILRGLIIGLLAGGAIGASIALLYAPKTGRRLRAELREKADNLVDESQEYIANVQEKASEIIEDAKDSITGLFKRAEREVNRVAKEPARTTAR